MKQASFINEAGETVTGFVQTTSEVGFWFLAEGSGTPSFHEWEETHAHSFGHEEREEGIPSLSEELRSLERGAGLLPAWARATRISELKKEIARLEEEIDRANA